MNISLLINHCCNHSSIKEIAEKILEGKRISIDECVELYEKGELSLLGILANHIREQKNGK